jgi:hypothetical protein
VAIGIQGTLEDAQQRVEAAGSDPHARLEALIRSLGFAMLDDQVPYRQIAKTALEQWFRQADAPDSERVPIRQGRRNEQIRNVIAPLDGNLAKNDIGRIAHALGLVVGTEAMIALTDAVGLDVAEAKRTLLDSARWLLTGALAELTGHSPSSAQGRAPSSPERSPTQLQAAPSARPRG